jgi:hypothetical protein
MTRVRPRAYSPGEGHRFDPGAVRCMHCHVSRRTPGIRDTCWVGMLYDYVGQQGVFRFDRLRTLISVGIFEEEQRA